MASAYAELNREELFVVVERQRARLEAYDMGMHQLYGALCTVMNRARAALRHGEPLDAQALLDFTEGRYHDVDDGVTQRLKEAKQR